MPGMHAHLVGSTQLPQGMVGEALTRIRSGIPALPHTNVLLQVARIWLPGFWTCPVGVCCNCYCYSDAHGHAAAPQWCDVPCCIVPWSLRKRALMRKGRHRGFISSLCSANECCQVLPQQRLQGRRGRLTLGSPWPVANGKGPHCHRTGHAAGFQEGDQTWKSYVHLSAWGCITQRLVQMIAQRSFTSRPGRVAAGCRGQPEGRCLSTEQSRGHPKRAADTNRCKGERCDVYMTPEGIAVLSATAQYCHSAQDQQPSLGAVHHQSLIASATGQD